MLVNSPHTCISLLWCPGLLYPTVPSIILQLPHTQVLLQGWNNLHTLPGLPAKPPFLRDGSPTADQGTIRSASFCKAPESSLHTGRALGNVVQMLCLCHTPWICWADWRWCLWSLMLPSGFRELFLASIQNSGLLWQNKLRSEFLWYPGLCTSARRRY